MPPIPLEVTAAQIDLSQRIAFTTAITASPAAGAETIVGTLVLNTDLTIVSGIIIVAQPIYVVGTSGVSETVKIRRTNVSGTTIVSTGAVVVAATNPRAPVVVGVDTGAAVTGQTYVCTLQVGSGSTASTLSAMTMAAFII